MTDRPKEALQNEQPIHGAVTAANTFTAWLARFAGIAAGISVFAYLIGWRQASGYFLAIGANWAVGMVDSASLIRLAAPSMFAIVAPAILSVMQIMQGATSAKFRKYSVWASVIAGLLINVFVLSIYGGHFSPAVGILALGIGVYAFYLCLGYSVGEIIALLYEDRYGEGPQIIWVVYFIFAFGFYNAPLLYGQALGQIDIENGFSNKEIAWVNSDQGLVRWRVVGLLGDKFLLHRSESWTQPSVFKVVTSDRLVKLERR